jgi:Domain of unknown function DUF83
MYSEDDLLPLSGIQHLMFCEREWGLIHIEQLWEENRLTAEGRVLHERAHNAGSESRQVRPEGFHQTESSAVEMDEATRKGVLVAYQKRKQEEIVHPFLKERVVFGIVPHVQAMLLARHLRGELDGCPSLFWR